MGNKHNYNLTFVLFYGTLKETLALAPWYVFITIREKRVN